MGFFDKKEKTENIQPSQNQNIFDVRREISDMKKLLDEKTKENERLKAAKLKAEEQKKQIGGKVRAQSKHLKRLKKKIERIEQEKSELKAENINLQTQARNSRERAKRYKAQLDAQ